MKIIQKLRNSTIFMLLMVFVYLLGGLAIIMNAGTLDVWIVRLLGGMLILEGVGILVLLMSKVRDEEVNDFV